MVIVKTGEFEVVLQNTSNVYMNQTSGMVQMNYEDGTFLKSNKVALSNETNLKVINTEKKLYEGSDLH